VPAPRQIQRAVNSRFIRNKFPRPSRLCSRIRVGNSIVESPASGQSTEVGKQGQGTTGASSTSISARSAASSSMPFVAQLGCGKKSGPNAEHRQRPLCRQPRGRLRAQGPSTPRIPCRIPRRVKACPRWPRIPVHDTGPQLPGTRGHAPMDAQSRRTRVQVHIAVVITDTAGASMW